MTTRDVVADFDEISKVYDETRDPLPTATVDALAARLRDAGIRSLLEVGVGTGRVARPLLDRGVELTGVDASWGMLGEAKRKGIDRLVRGNAYRLPFRDHAVEGVLFVHVLHLLDDPPAALREAARVGRAGAFALLHPRPDRGPGAPPREDLPRQIVREVLVEQGFDVPRRAGPWGQERELLGRLPPDRLDVLSDQEVTESLRSMIDRLSKRAHRYLLRIPPDALARAVEVARTRVGDRTVTYRRVEALARWGSHTIEDVGATAPA